MLLLSLSGCYKGQETIARLVTYDGVKQKLWGIHLDGPAEPGSAITVNGKKVGLLERDSSLALRSACFFSPSETVAKRRMYLWVKTRLGC